jgi:multiple antibiotic resistance protein
MSLVLLSRAVFAASNISLLDIQPGASKVFAILFLMLGPFKILVPFVDLTSKLERLEQVRMATIGIVMATIMVGLGGLIGRTILDNFDISIPVLSLTGGLILFLMALQTVLAQGDDDARKFSFIPGSRRSIAITPLAFPIIITPYGLAALIVFIALSSGKPGIQASIALIVGGILAIDWIAMIYAAAILARFGAALQIIAVVLGVVQTALGLQIMVRSLSLLYQMENQPG